MSTKKPKRLKLEDRVDILQRLEIGESSTNLAAEYGITISAISHMKRNKTSIFSQKQLLEKIQGNRERKRFTGIENSPLDKLLYDWYMQKQSNGDPPTGPIFQEQALIFNKLLNGSDTFKASSGFIAKFKKRYDIRSFSIEDEIASPGIAANDNFFREFSQYLKVHDYGMDQVYNADETELLWKTLPQKIPIIKVESDDELLNYPGQNTPDDRVTVIACANASGAHKLPLFVVGNSSQPRCLKNIRILPVVYRGQKCSGMDHNLILDWYKEVFIPEVTKRHRARGEKCILLLDCAQSHPPAETFNSISDICTVTYPPLNVTSVIQPMSQGIMGELKKVYKRNFLRLLLTEESLQDIKELLRSLTILHCCNFLSSSWNEITQTTIRNGWNDIFPCNLHHEYENVHLEPDEFLRIIRQIPEYGSTTMQETTSWLHQDDIEHAWRNSSNGELTTDEYGNRGNSGAKTEEENGENEPSAKNALRGINNVIEWYQTRWECTPHNLEFLEKLRALAVAEIVTTKV